MLFRQFTGNYFYSLLAVVLMATQAYSQWSTEVSGLSKPTYSIFSMSVVNPDVVWGSVFDSAGFITSLENGYYPTYKNLILRTVNGGAVWNQTSVNLTTGDSAVIDFIDAINADTAWVCMIDTNNQYGLIYRTSDGGTTWSPQRFNSAYPMFGSPYGYAEYVYFFNDSVGLCVGDSNGTGANNANPGYWEIYTTVNGGTTWTRVPGDSIPKNEANEFAMDNSFAASGNSVWFGTNYGNIYRSTNRGISWKVSPSTLDYYYPDSTAVLAIAMDSMNGMASDGVYFSITDYGGVTWSRISSFPSTWTTWLSAVPGTQGSNFVTSIYGYPGENGTSETTNGGLTWVTLDTLSHGAVSFLNESTGWCGGFNSNDTTGGMYIWNPSAGIVNFKSSVYRTLVYPNPMRDNAVIQISGSSAEQNDASLILCDALGNEVYSRVHLSGKQFEIHASSLTPGIYYYRLMSETSVLGAGKIVVE